VAYATRGIHPLELGRDGGHRMQRLTAQGKKTCCGGKNGTHESNCQLRIGGR